MEVQRRNGRSKERAVVRVEMGLGMAFSVAPIILGH